MRPNGTLLTKTFIWFSGPGLESRTLAHFGEVAETTDKLGPDQVGYKSQPTTNDGLEDKGVQVWAEDDALLFVRI